MNLDDKQNSSFADIPQKYQLCLNQISHKTLKKMYSNFSYIYLHIDSLNYNKEQIKNLLFNFLEKHKFITYKVQELKNQSNANAILCVEKKCLIIESIDINLLNTILKSTKSKIINSNKPSKEATNFLNRSYINISLNEFVQYTFSPIFQYLIERYFYPSHYFEDQTFFTFKNSKRESNDEEYIRKIEEVETNKERYEIICNKTHEAKKENSSDFTEKEFKEQDFIVLKTIYPGNKTIFNLAIHIETLYIFLIKRIEVNENIHEIEFCKKHSHRCMRKFYGFIKKKDEIVGFVYEYMSNKTLNDRMKSQISDIESFMIVTRLYQAIDYLHSNNLIHRDIKPSNILFDHNNVPYLSDFDRIKNADAEKMSFDFRSQMYSSPEQDRQEKITFSTDIFSFGLVIYFLFEGKELYQSYKLKTNSQEFPPMTKGPKKIQELYQSCVKINQQERLTMKEIYNILYEEATNLTLFEKFQIEDNISVAIEYFHENIFLLFNNDNEKEMKEKLICWYSNFLINYLKNKDKYEVSSFMLIFGVLYDEINGIKYNLYKEKEFLEYSAKLNHPNALLLLGLFYLKGKGYKQNYLKAREYFELSARQNNSDALVSLGKLYLFGTGVEKNIEKALELIKLSADQNNPEALCTLGSLYYYGVGVQQNYVKAKEYYEQSAKLNHSKALICLGELYEEGIFVEKNISKAIEYYEKSAKLNNDFAFLKLGDLYFKKNEILKAKFFYEKSAKLNNPDGLYNLGLFYKTGQAVEKNYLKAKECFEKSAYTNNNAEAILELGKLYFNGHGVPQNKSKAIKYLKQAAELNNSEALYLLGSLYYDGNYFKQDFKLAKFYFERATNNSNAFLFLGDIYFFGQSVDIDYKKSLEYYEKSFKLNNPKVFIKLANIYFNGYGTQPDYLKAKKFYELADEYNQDSNAQYILGLFYSIGLEVEINYTKAKEYFEKSADQKNSKALLELGNLYFRHLRHDKFYEKHAKDKYAKNCHMY